MAAKSRFPHLSARVDYFEDGSMKAEFPKDRLSQNILRCALCFAAVLITPWIAKPFALLFDWVCYSLMIKFFEEIFTFLFWVAELIAFFMVDKKRREKQSILGEELQNEGACPR